MHHRKVNLNGRLAGIALAQTGNDVAAAIAPELREVPSFPERPAAALPPAKEVAVLRTTLAELQRLIDKLKTQQTMTVEDVAQTTVELAAVLAERLVNNEIAANRQRLDRIVRNALERMQPTRTVTIRGQADDLALLERQMQEHVELETYRKLLTFRAETTYERGQLRLESDEWFIDWDTRRALAELRDALLEETFADE